MKHILCILGFHKWGYVYDNKVFPFTHYRHCERCGKVATI